MNVVLFAGGFGTRMSEYTHDLPKPMVEIGSYPMLWHIMRIYGAYGHRDVIVALGYKEDYVKSYFVNYYTVHTDFTIDMTSGDIESHTRPRIKCKITLVDTGLHTMTGGRLLKLRDRLKDGTFLCTYGDGVADVDINKLIDFHKQHGKLVTMTVARPSARFGVVDFDGAGSVRDFREKPADSADYVNAGFFVMEPEFLDFIDSEDQPLEQEPLRRAVQADQLVAYRHDGFWHCMDTKKDVTVLNRMWDEGNAPWKIWED